MSSNGETIVRSTPIRLSKSCIGEEEKAAVLRVLDAGFLGMGEEVRDFENDLQQFIGTTKAVVCVNTGTAALHLALECMDIGLGDEVLVPTLTYVASFQAVAATGAVPIPCDVLPESGFLDPLDARLRMTPRTKAIMPVHYASNSAAIGEIYALARECGLRVVEDAAHSFGCYREGHRIGVDGDVICFSFDGIKNITSGEGGAVVTGDMKLAARIEDARLLGVSRDTEKRYSNMRSWEFDVEHRGFRYHMSNIMAAIGRTQLAKYDSFANTRVVLARNYQRLLGDVKSLRLFEFDYDYYGIVPHIFPVRVVKGGRNEMMAVLRASGIECGVHYYLNHNLSYFKNRKNGCRNAESLYSQLITLPLHPDLTFEQQSYIAQVIEKQTRVT